MAPWKIECCTIDDATALGRNNGGAFWRQPMWRIMWPMDVTEEFMIEQLTKRMPLRLLKQRDAMRHQKAVDPHTGAILGYARWLLPDNRIAVGTSKPEWVEAQVPDVSPDQMKEFEELERTAWWDARTDLSELDRKTYEVRDRILAEKPYMLLDYLAVHPENAGRGIATSLVESGMRQAERMHIPIFIFAFKAARGIYLRLGFTEVDRVIQDDSAYGGDGEYNVYYMVYEVPKATS